MLIRRFALAAGLLLCVVLSQIPEFIQQYRQRLGGTLDEIRRTLAEFDAEAQAQSLDRAAGLARLRGSDDPLVRSRGDDLQNDQDRERRLAAQQRLFDDSSPAAEYWAFAERLDPALAARTYAIFQPAMPVTPAGFAAGGLGFVLGYGGIRLLAAPMRRRARAGSAA